MCTVHPALFVLAGCGLGAHRACPLRRYFYFLHDPFAVRLLFSYLGAGGRGRPSPGVRVAGVTRVVWLWAAVCARLN